MHDHEPRPLDLPAGAPTMHAHQDPTALFLMAAGTVGTFLGDHLFQMASLGIAAMGLYLSWRTSEAALEKYRARCFREWETLHHDRELPRRIKRPPTHDA